MSPRSRRSTYVASELGAARAGRTPLYILRLPGGDADPTLAGDQKMQDAFEPADVIDALESIRVEVRLEFRSTEATRNEDVGRFVRVAAASVPRNHIERSALPAAAFLVALLLALLLWQPSEKRPQPAAPKLEPEPLQNQREEPAPRAGAESRPKSRAQRRAPPPTDAGDTPLELVKTSSKPAIYTSHNQDAWAEAYAFRILLMKACKPRTGGELRCVAKLATAEGVPCTWSMGPKEACTVHVPKSSGGIVDNEETKILARIADARCCDAR